jgi:hypothetical protein
MIVELFKGVRWLDTKLHRIFGYAYNAVLGMGLTIEIIKHVREAGELHDAGIIRSALAIALFAVLLLHQLSELAEHVERRFRKSGAS